jgi:Uma2 family endonuclease
VTQVLLAKIAPGNHWAIKLRDLLVEHPAVPLASMGFPTGWMTRDIWGLVAALRMPSRHMTVSEFLDWDSGDWSGAIWQLRDGEPEMMAPASEAHGAIQARLSQLIGVHLDARGSQCRVIVTPGVIPRVRSAENCLVPDLAVTCAPPSGGRTLPEPVIVIEILSPSNETQTRANIWGYTTIPSVIEIVVLHTSVAMAEVLRRGPDGNWPAQPELRLDSIGFEAPLRAAYQTSGLG